MIAYLKMFFAGRELLPPRATWAELLISLCGGSISIIALLLLSSFSGHLFISAPFGASCVILYTLPHSPLAQPRNVFFGHLISIAVGIFFLKYIGSGIIAAGLAVGVAIALMQFFRCIHPPAGANPLVVLLGGSALGWDYLIFPFGAGAIVLITLALVINNINSKNRYPIYWLGFNRSFPSQDKPKLKK